MGGRLERPKHKPMQTMTDEELADYILEGPLLKHTGLDRPTVLQNIEQWRRLSDLVGTSLGCSGFEIPSQQKRVLHYYLPAYFWVRDQIGISAPQGCGKTTLVTELEKLLEHEGLLCAAVSIDDFYLTNADQNSLAEAHKDNWLLQGRGHAGTHDVALGTKTLQELTTSSGTVRVPRYDKSAFGGAGDRAELEKWHTVTPPLSVVLFEGWMLGFRPVGETTAAAVEASLPEVDRRLGSYQAAWDAFAHAWLVVEIEDAAWVFNWRLEAEQKMKEAGKDGMSDEEVHAFVARYMPAYKAYLPQLYAKGPTTAQPGRTLFIQVDEKRCLVGGRTLQ